ncbi:MAG: YAP1-binding protein 1 [Ramalina farinacea]|uniref:YAP1-binding protein 1 n=1 Tax=Ramalina farinacea TaxID=258253 RepID=A0AA43QN32_9LECA|nr:YAP1-binding protein 1 [Ramalina farinacea]
MADDSENPLIKALPPATDYISYLTLVEHNISKEQLPTLHKVLQDTTLTINIGWDLVHLLLPLLPDSEACLRDVARLGNPREVVLKVTELLEEIGREEEEDEDDEQADQEDADVAEEGADLHGASNQTPSKTTFPSKATRFSTLLSLLSILHPRIKTRYPSRFLSTSLQAILSAYTSPGLPSNTLCASAILDFTRQVAPGGSKRPTVPPRQSSSSIATLQAFQNTQRAHQSSDPAPDPEANTDGVDAGEEALQRRLLQSFMTYVAEVYLSRMPDDDADEDAPGMCWASRYMEIVQPKKIVPRRRTMSDLYSDEDKPYHERDTVVGSILAQSRDLSLSPHELLTTILKSTPSPTEPQPEEDQAAEDDSSTTLPSSPSDVPLSTSGALYILTATLASPLLFHRHHNPTTPPIDLPPTQPSSPPSSPPPPPHPSALNPPPT